MEFWNKLTQIGVYNGLARTSKLAIQTVNTLAVLGMVLSMTSIVISMMHQSTWTVYALSMIGWASAIFLNSKRWYYPSAILLSLMGILQILAIGYLTQDQSWFLWLLPVAVFPFFIFSVEYKNTALGLALTTILIYTSLQIRLHQESAWPFAEISMALGLVWWGYFAKQATEQTELALLEERANSKRLLHNFLPEKIAEKLRESGNKPPMIAQRYEHVTVLFADIVNFTPMSEKLSPEALVEVLNELFTEFDILIAKYKLEKIKTIGDAYMVAGGLPEEMPNHEEAAADFALEMLQAVKRVDKKWQHGLDMRIGMHCGPVVAGVIGQQKFAFDMWGDTVNVAARMESHGVPGHVHISEPMADILQKKYLIAQRGWVEVKGKGMMQTFWLKQKEKPQAQIPSQMKSATNTPPKMKPTPVVVREGSDNDLSDNEETVNMTLADLDALEAPSKKQMNKERELTNPRIAQSQFTKSSTTSPSSSIGSKIGSSGNVGDTKNSDMFTPSSVDDKQNLGVQNSKSASSHQSQSESRSESTNVFSRKAPNAKSQEQSSQLRNTEKDGEQSKNTPETKSVFASKSTSKSNPFRKRK